MHKRLLFAIIASILVLQACVSYRKRPDRLYKAIIRKNKTFDAAIVPGVPFKDGRWDTVMKGRVLWAVNLYNKKIVRNLIFSGGAVYTPYAEARIMGLYAQKLGVAAENIFYETQAEHSTENIFYSYELARKRGFKSVALVTDPFQSSMTKKFTRKRFGTKIYHIPFLVDTLKKYNHIEPVIDADNEVVPGFKSIMERERRFRRLRGTLGAFIPWKDGKRSAAPL